MQVQIHVTGITTPNTDRMNSLISNVMQTFPDLIGWSINVIDDITFDIIVELGEAV